jgi:hypothetical protein
MIDKGRTEAAGEKGYLPISGRWQALKNLTHLYGASNFDGLF